MTAKNPCDTTIWKAIDKACKSVLELPLNQHDWMWFKSYLFGSSIWYQKTSESLLSSMNDVMIRSISNKYDKTTIRDESNLLFCSCGAEMEITVPGVVYDMGAKCNLCSHRISPTTYFYHCPVGKNAAHPDTRGGYDYCQNCANRLIKEKKQKKAKETSESKDDSKQESKEKDATVTTTTTIAAVAGKNGVNPLVNRTSTRYVPDSNESEEVFYHKLVEISSNNLSTQYEFLKNEVGKIVNENKENKENRDSQKEALFKIVTVKEFMVCDHAIGVRQDSIIDLDTGEELLKYPNKPQFSNKELKAIDFSMKSGKTNMNIFHHYDANGYLSTLIVTANAVNSEFHDTMRKIFDIEYSTMSNTQLKLSYREGPVKTIARSQAKAEVCVYST